MAQTIFQGTPRQATAAGYLCQRQTFTLIREPDIVSLIPRLLQACRPSTIDFAVSLVVVNALNGHLRARTWPHVRIKGFKGLPCAVNATIAIVEKMRITRIHAPLAYTPVDTMLRRMGSPVGPQASFGKVALQAAATLRIARAQNVTCDNTYGATRAETFPQRMRTSRLRCTPLHDPSPKGLTSQINQSTHDAISLAIDNDPSKKCGVRQSVREPMFRLQTLAAPQSIA